MPAPRASARAQRHAARVAANRRPYVKSSEPNRWSHDYPGALGPPPGGRIDPRTNQDVRQAAALKAPVLDSIDRALGPGQVEVEMILGPHRSNIGDIGPIGNPPSNRTGRPFPRQTSGSGRMRADDPSTW